MTTSARSSRRLKEEREKRGWTQEYMANLLQIKIGTLSGYERGYRTPDLEMTKNFAGQ
ncbi:helix-turn-helix transcriptional regulator [Desulfallas sp. Bu1-1]|uniref:helix-turn-helix domain-containing protein n=1 Tax=Desulfallas sp. Bu1-1 TaxID=2787620 RepID=UPI00189EBA90|nr:helix-turn-helix transcriptional regulator [Desulfallas sp. Bu1-1]